MKILHIACLAGLLWLTGCATTGSTPDQASANGNTASTKGPASPHTPVIPVSYTHLTLPTTPYV